ncbi:MAG: TlpA family protein disulfide reductase [Williamsia sp.]|nr:TlpA family protein disulfide reductase [Williamsia sp.]
MKSAALVCIAAMLLSVFNLDAQTLVDVSETKIGEACPDFKLTNIINFPQPDPSIGGFKGKLLILDFWATWCAPCIEGLPRLDSLQKKYKNRIQIIGIGQEPRRTILAFFENRKKALHVDVNFPTTTDDTLLSGYFKHAYLPHFVWINQAGIVIAITDKDQLNESNIEACLKGTGVRLSKKTDQKLNGFNYDHPLLFDGNGVPGNLVLHSVLTRFIPGLGGMDKIYDKRILVLNYPKLYLYMLAYGGSKASLGFSPSIGFPKNRIILHLPDSVLSTEPPAHGLDSIMEWQKRNAYCYDVVLPGYTAKPKHDSALQTDLYQTMQRDLDNAFPIKASIERKKVKCLVLVRTSTDDKLKSKGGKPEYELTAYSLHLRNIPLNNFIYYLRYISFQLDSRPFIDEVQYSPNADIDINAMLSDPISLSRELKKYGLDLIEVEREIDMLVLTDK